MRAAIITVSTSVAAGRAQDTSGDALAAAVSALGAEVVAREVLADDRAGIEAALRRLAAPERQIALILTTGGTGLTVDDVTPEATRAVIERDVPGLAEAMRAESVRHTPMGMLSRGVSGVVGRTLIVNFPGNPRAVDELFGVIAPVLVHATELIARAPGRPWRADGHREGERHGR
jgi:molybdopterin adenylyltransferase